MFPRLTRNQSLACSATLLTLASLPAHAAGPDDRSGYGFDLGLGASVRPAYEGSDDEKLRALPIVRGFYNTGLGRFSLGREGLGWSVPLGHFEVGASLGYEGKRKESASADLAGLGDIKGSTTGGLFGIYHLGALDLRVGGKSALSRSNRAAATFDVSANYRIRLSERWMLSPGVGATWANDHYMQRYFGVSAEQSANSGLPEFSAGSGWKTAGVGVNVMYRLSRRWGLMANVRDSVMLGDAADSPIVRKKNQVSGMFGVTYRWHHQ